MSTIFFMDEEEKATLSTRVADRIREAIYTNEFKEGQRLVQEELAQKLGVSRMPIRDAFQQLEKEGLIELIPRKGAIVLPVQLSDIVEIYELRAVLECMAVEKSLPNITPEDIDRMEKLIINMEELNINSYRGIEQYIELNRAFHTLLRRHCTMRRLNQIIENLWTGIAPLTPKLMPKEIERSNAEHREMVSLIKTNRVHDLLILLKSHINKMKESLTELVIQSRKENR